MPYRRPALRTQPREMLGLLVASLVLLFFPLRAPQASSLSDTGAKAFFECQMYRPDSADEFVNKEDLAIAYRLDIRYREAPSKPLISWHLSEMNRDRLRQHGLDGQFRIEDIDDRYSRLVLFPADSAATQSWVFRDGELVSSVLNGVREWKQRDSAHFRFFISDTSLFHDANVTALESFLADMASLLGFTDADMALLSREKIYYCFCSNQQEIRALTGYAARGMYILSHDLIVSTYSAHFHELAHLLVNYRLKQPHLHTHPLLLEGFAVATGGRGGRTPGIMQQLGLHFHRAGWISTAELLEARRFWGLDATMSYPASATYNRFLTDHLGVAAYLDLYDRFGGDAPTVSQMRIPETDLPSDIEWQQFLSERPRGGLVTPGIEGLESVGSPFAFEPLTDSTQLGFAVPKTTLAFEDTATKGYCSVLFEQLIDGEVYGGQRYLIRASSEEVGVYDLWTNTMIAHYALAFTEDPVEIPVVDGFYVFQIDRSLFPGDLPRGRCRFIQN